MLSALIDRIEQVGSVKKDGWHVNIYKRNKIRPGITNIFIFAGITKEKSKDTKAYAIVAVRENRIIYFTTTIGIGGIETRIEALEHSLDNHTVKFPHGDVGMSNYLTLYFSRTNTLHNKVKNYSVVRMLKAVRAEWLPMLRQSGPSF